MKKKTALVVSAFMLISCLLGGCNSSGTSSGSAADTSQESSAQQESSASAAESTASTEDSTASAEDSEPEHTYVYAKDKGEMRGLTAKELIAEMNTGWNLGNSLDATTVTETGWGNPVTTKEMIDAVKAKGFDVLRVPVTWYPHLSDNVIDEQFMNRVEEVVGYGIDNGMFVILNTHHEQEKWLKPDDEHIDKVEEKLKIIWEQIADRFADYGDHLIFEGLNEARIKGSQNEWNGGTKEGRACINRLNDAFVETVRASGGNNAKRLLLVTTYAQSAAEAAFKDAKIVFDDYTAVTLHAYTPYAFTYHSGESYEMFDWDSSEDVVDSIESLFKIINKCVLSQGVPVIITEWGAVVKPLEDGTLNTEAVCAWSKDYLEIAKRYGVPCVRWDNNCYDDSNERFGLLDREKCEWYCEEIVDAIVNEYKE